MEMAHLPADGSSISPKTMRDYLILIACLFFAFLTVQGAYGGRFSMTAFLYDGIIGHQITAFHIGLVPLTVALILANPWVMWKHPAFFYLIFLLLWGAVLILLKPYLFLPYMRLVSHLFWFFPLCFLVTNVSFQLNALAWFGVAYSVAACLLFFAGIGFTSNRGFSTIADYSQQIFMLLCTAIVLLRRNKWLKKLLCIMPIALIFALSAIRHTKIGFSMVLVASAALLFLEQRNFFKDRSLSRWYLGIYFISTALVVAIMGNRDLLIRFLAYSSSTDFHSFDLYYGITQIAQAPLFGEEFEFHRSYYSNSGIYLHSDLVELWRRFGLGGALTSFLLYWLPVAIISPKFKTMDEVARRHALAIWLFCIVSAIISLVAIPQITWEQNSLFYAWIMAISFRMAGYNLNRFDRYKRESAIGKNYFGRYSRSEIFDVVAPFAVFSTLALVLIFGGRDFMLWLFDWGERGGMRFR